MTDNEIIKALEYCANHKDCDDGCPCVISESPCIVNDPYTLFNLINRQKAEIERLKAMVEAAAENVKIAINERFSDEIQDSNSHLYLMNTLLDNLVKEMEGDNG